MATNFSKKTVQNAGIVKKSKFDLTHDFSTSFNWGEIQPLMCRLLPTASSNTVKLSSLIRLSAMNVPTFGRVAFKQSWHFVPMADLYPNYKNLLSGVPTSEITNNTDTSISNLVFPTVTPQALMYLLLGDGNCMYDLFTRTGNNVVENEWTYTNGTYTDVKLFPSMTSSSPMIKSTQAIDTKRFQLYNVLGFKSKGMEELIYPTASDFTAIYAPQAPTNPVDHLVCFKLSTKGRRLYKILLDLGYQVDFRSTTQLNILPLLAFYKAYFDAYSLPQYDNWEMTNAFKLIKLFYEYGSFNFSLQLANNVLNSQAAKLFKAFIKDLTECYYSENMDYVSAHIPTTGLPGSNDQEFSDFHYQIDGSEYIAGNKIVGTNGAVINGVQVSTSQYLDQVSDELLKKLYIAVNRDSAIGYQIKDRLIARGYKTYVDECKSNFIKGATTPIQISDVNSLADTTTSVAGEGQPLGAYAGKGLQYDESDTFTYENSEIGYLVGIGTIVPVNSGYPFSLDPTLLGINRYTFYNPEYDSLSYEQTPKLCIGHNKEFYVPADSTHNEDKVFGYIPRYSGYKIANNRLSGCFAFKSERQSWMPYTLDRDIIENNDAEFTPSDETASKFTYTAATNGIAYIPVAGKEWRYPTNNSWKGNYNRIFYNEGMQDDGNPISPFFTHSADESYLPTSDNFLFHSVIQHDQWANMLPIAESFDTIDDEKNAPTLDVKD